MVQKGFEMVQKSFKIIQKGFKMAKTGLNDLKVDKCFEYLRLEYFFLG